MMGQRYTPIEKVGICVPRSPVAFPSTILMNVIPAKIAGVRDIVLVTPPEADGTVSAAALAAARIAGVDKIFKVGGAQAVAALAYPLYCRTLKKERERIAPEILRLADELIQ